MKSILVFLENILNTNAIIFFLPIKTRSLNLPDIKLPKDHKFWHTGIIYKNKIYETFNHGKYSISKFNKKELNIQEAEYTEYKIDINKLYSELNSGTSCGTYVARVVGVCNSKGSIKTYYPDDIYNIIKR